MNGINKHKIETKIGDRFGRLVVISEPFLHKFPKRKSPYPTRSVKCRCDCSTKEQEKIVTISIYNLFDKRHLISCGCVKNSGCTHLTITHGMSRTPLYRLYQGMFTRCNASPNNPKFRPWTSKGIKVCKEWDENFLVFREWALNNGYQEGQGLSIHRKDSNKNYGPDNCELVEKKAHGILHIKERDDKIKKLELENQRIKDYINTYCDINHFNSVMNNNKI